MPHFFHILDRVRTRESVSLIPGRCRGDGRGLPPGKCAMFGWRAKQGSRAAYLAEHSGATGAAGGATITGIAGLLDGTRIATRLGWRPVEALSLGDEVLTFDHGMQRITDIQSELYDSGTRPGQRPVRIPEGALGNRRDLWLMPDQGMLVECDAVQDPLGDPFIVVPAQALEGFRDIALTPTESTFEATILTFAQDEAIYVEGGMLAFCPHPRALLDLDCPPALYETLEPGAARRLVQEMIRLDMGLGLACDPEELAGVKMRHTGRPVRFSLI